MAALQAWPPALWQMATTKEGEIYYADVIVVGLVEFICEIMSTTFYVSVGTVEGDGHARTRISRTVRLIKPLTASP